MPRLAPVIKRTLGIRRSYASRGSDLPFPLSLRWRARLIPTHEDLDRGDRVRVAGDRRDHGLAVATEHIVVRAQPEERLRVTELRSGTDRHGLELARMRGVDELATVSAPARSAAGGGRDLPALARRRVWLDIDLAAPRLVRLVGDQPAVGRDASALLVRRRGHEWLARTGHHVDHLEIAFGPRRPRFDQQVASVGKSLDRT